jgi:hypothetical protein
LAVAPFVAGLALACGSDGPSAPPAPATIQATTATTQTATVGAAVAAVPTVKVLSEDGSPVANASVTFAVVQGGGSIQTTAATTNVDGIASAGSWTLGTTVGENAVDATVEGMTPVHFTASATAGVMAALDVSAGDNQSAAVGVALTTAPAAVARDQYGNAVAGVAVSFAVKSGGGALASTTATTGADGIAHAGAWTLGIVAGAQEVEATSGALSATFHATAIVPAGCSAINYAVGATLPLNWESDDCTDGASGKRYDRLQFTTTTQQQIMAEVNGPNGRSLFLRDSRDLYVGRQPSTAFSPATQNPMRLKYVLAPGTYTFEPYAPDATTTGAYTLSTTPNTPIDCDYIVFASTNVTIDGVVDGNSCVGPGGGREQWINLQLKTGMKVKLTLSGTDNVPFLVFRDDRLGPASPTLATAQGTTAGESISITWTATFDTWHEIIVTSTNGLLGKYKLTIEEIP